MIHPKTGRVCVPIPIPPRKGANSDWSALENFNPLTVPTVTDILNEIDTWQQPTAQHKSKDTHLELPEQPLVQNGHANGAEKVQDYEKTALKPYVDYFKIFVAELLMSEPRSVKRERDEDAKDSKADVMEF